MTRLFLFTLIPVASLAQQQPELPPDYFNRKVYTVSAALKVDDTAAVRKELTRLADSAYHYSKAATINYRITDSLLRNDQAMSLAAAAPLLGRYKEAWDALQLYSKAMHTNTRIASSHFLHELYLVHQLAGSASAITEAINQKISSLDADYRKDNVSTLKGVFHPDYIVVLNKRVNSILQQAIQGSNNQIEFGNVGYLLHLFLLKDLLETQSNLLQQSLYALDPSKVEKSEVFIPMRDAVKLSALVFRDVNASEKQPAIISQSPYPSGTEATRGNIFGSNGYVYVYVDTRGRRNSEGNFFPYENDARDYYDIIDWISKQPWCNGKVATSGGSYLGFAQWQAIRKQYRHPALKAINPMVSVGFGVDFPRESNIFYSYILQWAMYVSGKELNDALFNDYNFWTSKNLELYRKHIPFSKLDSVAGTPNAFFKKWVSHPDFDSYWQGILPSAADYAALDIPVLTITGYYDDDQNGAMYYYKNHHKYNAATNHHLLIGPFDHYGSQWNPAPNQGRLVIEKEAQIPVYKYVIKWFDWRLKGAAKPAWIKDKITWFATGTGQWRGTPSFKAATTDTLKFYLSNVPNTEKRRTMYLLQPKPTEARLVYKHNITEAIDSAFLFASSKPGSDSLSVASKYNLIFETAPLPQDIMITDEITTNLYASLNVRDADFQVNYSEITPDGKYLPLGSSLLRCRYRNSDSKPTLMTPGKPEKLPFTTAYIYLKKMAKGSKLRMEFEMINRPTSEKNYGFGGVVANETTSEPRLIETTILRGTINVPIGKL